MSVPKHVSAFQLPPGSALRQFDNPPAENKWSDSGKLCTGSMNSVVNGNYPECASGARFHNAFQQMGQQSLIRSYSNATMNNNFLSANPSLFNAQSLVTPQFGNYFQSLNFATAPSAAYSHQSATLQPLTVAAPQPYATSK